MSWKSISGNQTVSRANLQNAIDTGVFISRNGVPGTETNRQITKANAQNYVYTWDLYPSFRDKTSNQLVVKSNLAVPSNQVYAVADTTLYLGSNDRSWIFPIFSASGDNWGSVASATDNRCILAGKSYNSGSGGGSAYVSNNYGESFTRLDSIITTNDACLGAAMNSYGDYMIITRQVGSFGSNRAYIYWSYNSGVNWATGYHDGVDYNFNGAAMSGVGVYATVLGSDGTNYYVFTSNNFGSSFTKTLLCSGPKVVQGGCVAMSKSGQYQLLTPPQASSPDSGKCFISNDWGTTWTSFYLTVPPLLPWNIFYGCSVSAGGDYMTISSYSSVGGTSSTWISNDWGVTWTQISGAAIGQSVDSSGQFQYQDSRASTDYGYTWSSWFSARAISVNQTTNTTPYIYGVSTGGNLYKSINQGYSYSAVSLSGYITKVATSGGSNNGQFVAAIADNGSINYSLYKSTDYGATWSNPFNSSGEVMTCCAVSNDGTYWLVVTYNQSTNTSYIFRSTDGGSSFAYTYVSYNGQAENCAISNNGQYMTIIINYSTSTYNSYIVNSSNYGAAWNYSSGGYNNTGRVYNDIAMSGQGKYRLLVNTDSGNTGCRTFYSSDYGNTWAEKYYNTGFYATSCDMDDSGQVCLVGNVANDNLASKIFYTIDGWNSYGSYSTAIYPLPLARPTISGVNVSSDGTYWAAVANNSTYVFTCNTGNGAFNYLSAGVIFNRLSK